jgi:hypothetical protein
MSLPFEIKRTKAPRNGLIAELKFSGGNANDTSGNGNNGTVNGTTPTKDSWNRDNEAVSFDGIDDYVDIPINPADYNEMTIRFRIWNDGTDSVIRILDNSNIPDRRTSIRIINNRLNFVTKTSDESLPTFSGNTIIQKNVWTDCVVYWKWNNPNFDVKFWVNGEYDTGSGTYISNQGFYSSNWEIGRSQIKADYAKFKLDDLRFYDRILSDSEIEDLYYESEDGYTLLDRGVILRCRFNGNVLDTSGINHNVTNHGTTPTLDKNGGVGMARSFNGIDNWINTNYQDSPSTMTFRCIMKMDSVSGINAIFEKDGVGLDVNLSGLPIVDGEVRWATEYASGVYDKIESDRILVAGVWYDIIITINSTGASMWINGKFEKFVSGNNFTSGAYLNSRNWQIGKDYQASNDRYFNGDMDLVEIYNRELSNYEIKALYKELPNTDLLLYSYGNEIVGNTGGWTTGYVTVGGGSFTHAKNNDNILCSIVTSITGGTTARFATVNKINITEYSSILIEWESTQSADSGDCRIFITDDITTVNSVERYVKQANFPKETDVYDISDLHGSYHLNFSPSISNGTGTIKLYSLKLIK